MIGKLVCLVRSDIQVNAHTTYGVFASDEDAKWFVEEELKSTIGSKPGQYMILNFKFAGEE